MSRCMIRWRFAVLSHDEFTFRHINEIAKVNPAQDRSCYRNEVIQPDFIRGVRMFAEEAVSEILVEAAWWRQKMGWRNYP